jgi:hypothetical protein
MKRDVLLKVYDGDAEVTLAQLVEHAAGSDEAYIVVSVLDLDDVEVQLRCRRDETAEELEAREAAEKRRAAGCEQRERAEYERLKAKFEAEKPA